MSIDSELEKQEKINVAIAQTLTEILSAVSKTLSLSTDMAIQLVSSAGENREKVRNELFPAIESTQKDVGEAIKRIQMLSNLVTGQEAE